MSQKKGEIKKRAVFYDELSDYCARTAMIIRISIGELSDQEKKNIIDALEQTMRKLGYEPKWLKK